MRKKLSDFECGYICAVASLVYNHGAGVEAEGLYREVGLPTLKQMKNAGMSEFDIEGIKRLRKDMGLSGRAAIQKAKGEI
jgi:hypothetical protein